MYGKKILFFADKLPPLIGGMEIHAKYFIKHFKRILVVSKNQQNQDCLVINNIKHAIDLSILKDCYKPDIVFFNSGRWIEELLEIKDMFPNVPFIYRTGGNEILQAALTKNKIPEHHNRQSFWVNMIDKTIDLIVINSNYTEQRLRTLGIKVKLEKCIGGVDVDFIKSIPLKKTKDFTLFCAARFVPYKNHHLIIDICKRLVDRGLKFKIRLAGDGLLLEEIKKRVHSENLKNIIFLGVLTNKEVSQEIVHSNLYLQLSIDYKTIVPGGDYIHSECMGRAVLEAISAGTLVMASNSGALSEIINDDNGILVDLSQIEEICNRIKTLIKSTPDKLEYQNSYCWNILFQNYERIFEELNENLASNRKI